MALRWLIAFWILSKQLNERIWWVNLERWQKVFRILLARLKMWLRDILLCWWQYLSRNVDEK